MVTSELLLVQAQEDLRGRYAGREILSWLIDVRSGNVRDMQRDLPLFLAISRMVLYSLGKASSQVVAYQFTLSAKPGI